MDVLTPDQRHRAMQHIHGRDTSIEIELRKALWHRGYRYRKNWKALPGTPDIVLTKYRIAIFCDSEFFHGKNWGDLSMKIRHGNNPAFWEHKIQRNMQRDIDVNQKLRRLDWYVLRFWGADIKKHLDECIQAVEDIVWEQKISRYTS